MLTLPLCLGGGKPRTATLGAITLSSYYQSLSLHKDCRFGILMAVSEGLEKGLVISCRFYPAAPRLCLTLPPEAVFDPITTSIG
jgi:hypothetical protein